MYHCDTMESCPYFRSQSGMLQRNPPKSDFQKKYIMENKTNNRTKWLHIRLNAEEFDVLNGRLKKTTCRKMSDYARSVLFQKKITVTHRDRSLDDVLEELILLRKELNFVGNNFNQAVKKLNSVSGMPESQTWQAMMIVLRDQLEPQVGAIKEKMTEYSKLWSQRLSMEKI